MNGSLWVVVRGAPPRRAGGRSVRTAMPHRPSGGEKTLSAPCWQRSPDYARIGEAKGLEGWGSRRAMPHVSTGRRFCWMTSAHRGIRQSRYVEPTERRRADRKKAFFRDRRETANMTSKHRHAYASWAFLALVAAAFAGCSGLDDSDVQSADRNRPPQAELSTSNDVVWTDDDVTFDASGSEDPDGNITEYTFDF